MTPAFWNTWLYLVMTLFMFLLYQRQIPHAGQRLVLCILWPLTAACVWSWISYRLLRGLWRTAI